MDDNRFKILNLFDSNFNDKFADVHAFLSQEFCSLNRSKLNIGYGSKKVSIDECLFDFVFVPGVDNPRWLVKNSKSSIDNLGFLVKPTSFWSKSIWKISVIANRFNLFGVFYKWRLRSSRFDFQDFLQQTLNDENIEITAIYTGARSKEAKFIIQISKNNAVKYYCKIGMTEVAIQEVATELKTLQYLSSRLKAIKLPPVVTAADYSYHGFSFFLTDNIIGNNVDVDLSLTEYDILAMLDMASLEVYRSVDVSDIRKQLDGLDSSSLELSRLDKISSRSLTFTPAHGDYIPWNRVALDGDVLLLDWERYGFYPLFFDHIYFIIHVCVLVRHETAEACHNQLINHIFQLITNHNLLYSLMKDCTIDSYICGSIIYIYRNYISNESYNETCMLDFLEELFLISSSKL